jgi:hypothetical protein
MDREKVTAAREGAAAAAEIQMRSPLLLLSLRDSDPNTVPSAERTLSH